MVLTTHLQQEVQVRLTLVVVVAVETIMEALLVQMQDTQAVQE